MVTIEQILKIMIEKNASDLHLKVNCPPTMRINKELVAMEMDAIGDDEIQAIASGLMNERQQDVFDKKSEIDFAYSLPSVGRFRTNIFVQRGTIGIVMRSVKTVIPTFSDLTLPGKLFENIINKNNGIIIVCGPMGCGKSSTLAALIDYINRVERVNIVTVEDPIEFLHTDKKSIVNQREVGIDTHSFKDALRYIMRQDPDVIAIGEMRDAESLNASMMSAEIGHLVLTTLHSVTAAQSVARMLEFYQVETRDQIRRQLSDVLHAVICQRLVPRADDKGLVPVLEVMIVTPTVKKLIYNNQLDKLPAAIELGKEFGMHNFNQSFIQLVNDEIITKEVALTHSLNPEALKLNLQGIFLDDSHRILDA
ncbi:MAG: PilT/PilU family type 4a pilus ATPase [Candidatus Ancaeobacter aquaticus]|nr:PilT/PilU family type 4a pilus ATPase [Candidatus Ancaeobacter aquaticus]